MKVLITGITGFVGSHLAEYCLSRGAEVWGTKRWRSNLENISGILDRIKLMDADVTDSSAVRRVLDKSKPDWVFHLAAQSYVPASFIQPRETLHTNIQGQINFLHGLKEGLFGKLLAIGSSEEYGQVEEDEIPITEENPLRPLSPYAVSKVTQDLLSYQYFKSYGLHVVRTRAFNHTGPRRGYVFAESNFAKQIAEIENGENKEHIISVGNLEAIRDYTDVRDTVRAYWLALEKGEPGKIYNICSGRGWKIQTVLDILLSKTSIKDITVVRDESRMRPSDVPILVGSPGEFKRQTGWEAVILFETTLFDLLNYWRKKIPLK